jgi:hypothetical protein
LAQPVSIVRSHPHTRRSTPIWVIQEDIGPIARRGKSMNPVAASCNVREQEIDPGVARRERAELDGVAGFLAGIVAPAMLPDVVQHRNAAVGGRPTDRVQQRVIGSAARGKLDTDHAGIEAAIELGEGMTLEVGIDDGVPADP